MKLSELDTGDILLFSNRSSMLDKLISYFTDSIYTHVAMVIKDPPGYPGLHMIESSLEPMPDEIEDKKIFGVQLQPLGTALTREGTVVCRKLSTSYPLCVQDVMDDIHKIYGDPYDIRPLDWLLAELKVLDPKIVWEQQNSSFWCSALVAYIYVKIGLLPDTVPWTLISPADWGNVVNKNTNLPFIDCALGDPESIETD